MSYDRKSKTPTLPRSAVRALRQMWLENYTLSEVPTVVEVSDEEAAKIESNLQVNEIREASDVPMLEGERDGKNSSFSSKGTAPEKKETMPQEVEWVYDPKGRFKCDASVIRKSWNGVFLFGIPVLGAVSARVYYLKSREFVVKFLAHKIANRTPGVWEFLRFGGAFTGILAVETNALFNFMACMTFGMNFYMGDKNEREILFDYYIPRKWTDTVRKGRLFKKLVEQGLLIFLSMFASIALSKVSEEEEKRWDFWVYFTLAMSMALNHVSISFLLESLRWLYNEIKEAGQATVLSNKEEIRKIILQYYNELLQAERSAYSEKYGIEKGAKKEKLFCGVSEKTLFGKLFPYLVISIPSSVLLLSRLGVVYKGMEGAEDITKSDEGFGYWLVVLMAAFPAVALGFKSFNSMLYNLIHINTVASSIAEETYPVLRRGLLYMLAFFAAFSFASNSQLCTEAAEEFEFTARMVVFFAIIGGLGSDLVNIFGIRILVDRVVELISRHNRCCNSEETAEYAEKVAFLQNYSTNLSLTLEDEKARIEYLIAHPEIITKTLTQLGEGDLHQGRDKMRSAINDVGFVLEDVVRIWRTMGYNKKRMGEIMDQLNFPADLQTGFQKHKTNHYLYSQLSQLTELTSLNDTKNGKQSKYADQKSSSGEESDSNSEYEQYLRSVAGLKNSKH